MVSLHRAVHILVCMGRIFEGRRSEKGAMNMTDRRRLAWSGEPPQQDIDDLIFLGQSGPGVSQR